MRRNDLDPKSLQQSVERTYQQCGVFDLLLGYFYLIYSAMTDFAISGFQAPRRVSIFVLALWVVFLPGVLLILQRKFVEPRVGYYRRSQPLRVSKVFVVGAAILALFPLFAALVAKFWLEEIGFEPWLRWTPVGFGVLVGSWYFSRYRATGLPGFAVMGGFVTLLGIVLTAVPMPARNPGVAWLFGLLAVASWVLGGVNLVLWLKKYPREEMSPDEGIPGLSAPGEEANHESR